MEQLSLADAVARMAMASVLGGVLGLQRETKGKPAGLKTHMMVSLGSAAFTLLTLQIFLTYTGTLENARSDPLRIIEGVVGGIGFLGAGTIIQARGSVRGITTAAGIWVVGSVGIACGIGNYPMAAMVAAMAFLILTVFDWIERRYVRSGAGRTGEKGEGRGRD
jgi:putative Mg2+ transporter-C (MgtC) family protein